MRRISCLANLEQPEGEILWLYVTQKSGIFQKADTAENDILIHMDSQIFGTGTRILARKNKRVPGSIITRNSHP